MDQSRISPLTVLVVPVTALECPPAELGSSFWRDGMRTAYPIEISFNISSS